MIRLHHVSVYHLLLALGALVGYAEAQTKYPTRRPTREPTSYPTRAPTFATHNFGGTTRMWTGPPDEGTEYPTLYIKPGDSVEWRFSKSHDLHQVRGRVWVGEEGYHWASPGTPPPSLWWRHSVHNFEMLPCRLHRFPLAET